MGGKERKTTHVRTIEELLPEATSVGISIGRQIKLVGEGTPALEELVRRHGQKGVDAFNKAFVTPEFEKGIKDRIERLEEAIDTNFDQEQKRKKRRRSGTFDVSKFGLFDQGLSNERADLCEQSHGLQGFLLSLEQGVDLEIGRPEAAKSSAEAPTFITLKRPSVVIAKSS